MPESRRYGPTVNVLAVQLDSAWENKPVNFQKARALIGQSSPARDSVVVLPEMFATGFSMNVNDIAESYGGVTEQFLAETARVFGIYLVAGVAMRSRDGLPRNKALIFSPAGDLIAFYAKRRPFTFGGESEHYTAGQQGIAFPCKDCTIAPFICYDLRFPELFCEVVAAHRPEVITVIANWPEKRIHHWTRLLQARAIENQAYVIGVNRVGKDPAYRYTGKSAIIDWHGEIVAEAGDAETVLRASLDIDTLREYRRAVPFLDDLVPRG